MKDVSKTKVPMLVPYDPKCPDVDTMLLGVNDKQLIVRRGEVAQLDETFAAELKLKNALAKRLKRNQKKYKNITENGKAGNAGSGST